MCVKKEWTQALSVFEELDERSTVSQTSMSWIIHDMDQFNLWHQLLHGFMSQRQMKQWSSKKKNIHVCGCVLSFINNMQVLDVKDRIRQLDEDLQYFEEIRKKAEVEDQCWVEQQSNMWDIWCRYDKQETGQLSADDLCKVLSDIGMKPALNETEMAMLLSQV